MSVGLFALVAYLLEVGINHFAPVLPPIVLGITALVAAIALLVGGLGVGPGFRRAN